MNFAKRIVSCVLVLMLTLTCFTGITTRDEILAEAAEYFRSIIEADKWEGYANNYSVKYLEGLSGEDEFILVEHDRAGYAIFNKSDMQIVEYSAESLSPFASEDIEFSRYGGPLNYYVEKYGAVTNIMTGESIDVKQQQQLSVALQSELARFAEEARFETGVVTPPIENDVIINGDELLDAITPGNSINSTPTEEDFEETDNNADAFPVISSNYVPNYEYFLDLDFFGDNVYGTCVTVAAQILMGYGVQYIDGRLVSDEDIIYKNSDKKYLGNKGTSNDFYNELLNLIDPNYITDRGSTFEQAYNGIKAYLEGKGLNIGNDIQSQIVLNYSMTMTQTELETTIRNSIDDGYPLMVSMYRIKDEDGQITKNPHAIVVYGYQTIYINNQIADGFVAHYGFINRREDKGTNELKFNNMWFNKKWLRTSYLSIRDNHDHTLNANSCNVNNGTHIKTCNSCGLYYADDNHSYDTISFYYSEGIDIPAHGIGLPMCDEFFHQATCFCGKTELQPHHYLYQQLNSYTHRKYCTICGGWGETSEQEHFFKVGNVCWFCGVVDNPAYSDSVVDEEEIMYE